MTREELEIMAAAHYANGNPSARWSRLAPEFQGRQVRRMRLAVEALERHRAQQGLAAGHAALRRELTA